MRRGLAMVVALALSSAGCINVDFDPPHLVKSERILGIRADPPEVEFGQDVVFESLLVDERGEDLASQPGVELRWSVCVSLAEVVSSAGLGASVEFEDDCGEGGADRVVLESEGLPPNAARLPGSALMERLAMLPMGGGSGAPGGQPLDPALLETLSTVLAEVGIPLSVRLEVRRDGEPLFTGVKRFAITQQEDPTTNPPPPRFAVDGVWLSARDGDPHVCVPEASAPAVAADTEVELDPDDDEEAWLETYPVVALNGAIQTNEESAYYSWFTTGGAMGENVTQRPNDPVTWTTPAEPGEATLWVVVRDGHLGMSWCRATISVE